MYLFLLTLLVILFGYSEANYTSHPFSNIELCADFCRNCNKTSSLTFCQCKVKIESMDTSSLLTASFNMVSASLWPVTERMCVDTCRLLESCYSHRYDFPKVCSISSLDPNKTAKSTSNTVISPKMTTSTLNTAISLKMSTATSSTVKHVPRKEKRPCKETCRKRHGECFDGECVCKQGYVNQPDEGEGKCQKVCTLYSDDFTQRATRSCSTNHLVRIPSPHIPDCKKRCANRYDDMFCVAFRYQKGGCYMLKRKRPTAWSKGRWFKVGCNFYTRNCENVPTDTCGDCGRNRRCDRGRCLCKYGYSLVFDTNTCVKACHLTVDEYSLHSTRLCVDVYQRTYKNMGLKSCKEKCNKNQARECTSLQIYNNICYLQDRSTSFSKKPWDDWGKCRHYQKKCRGCDRDCVGPKYICKDGQCNCNHGYHPTTNSECVAECRSYTDNFDQNDSDCPLKYTKRYRHVSKQEDCETRCKTESFQCGAFTMIGNICHTFKWTQELLDKKQWLKQAGCRYFVRRCLQTEKLCNPECNEPAQVCENGKCICNIGYHKTTDNQCVPYCQEYGRRFTKQPHGVCYRHSAESYVGLRYHECKHACLANHSSDCHGVELMLDMCYITTTYKEPPIVLAKGWCDRYTRMCNHRADPCLYCPEGSRCVDQKCTCDQGYLRVPGSNTCVKKCLSPGDTYTAHNWSKCRHSYYKEIPNDSNRYSTDNKCRAFCLHDSKCIAYYTIKKICHIASSDPRTQTTGEPWANECTFYLRDCVPNCERGNSLILKENKCVWKCREYTDKFQLQSKGTCLSKYHKKYKRLSEQRCRRKCLETWDKLCDSFELFERNCYISAVEKQGQWKTYKGCTHYQRLCIL